MSDPVGQEAPIEEEMRLGKDSIKVKDCMQSITNKQQSAYAQAPPTRGEELDWEAKTVVVERGMLTLVILLKREYPIYVKAVVVWY